MPDEIDEWYMKEKERITHEYHAIVKRNRNQNIERLRPAYEKKLKALIGNYHKRHESRIKKEKLVKRIRAPFESLDKTMRRRLKFLFKKAE